ncbi:MAG TPA: hypothetical protein VMS17_27260 [Gemmataceae bacterium]|nr:hypothetical protein [Gemmataceae bacterium]
MVQTCSKCSRANPADAVYCYYDGLVLGGHSRNGGPVAVGAQIFARPFVFPTGKTCRSFNELALACQDDWDTARDLLMQGYFETFLGGLGRMDLVVAAKEASKFPDHDRGLDQFLGNLPADVLDPPQLAVETQEVNLGILCVGGAGREFHLRLENKGMRLLHGAVTCSDGVWLSFGDGPAAAEKHFQFRHEYVLPVRVVADRLRAGSKPLEAHLNLDANGGALTVTIRAQAPVTPFPNGVLAGATSPRKIAEKAKAQPKQAALLFESGEVAGWYKTNGWTYPVQGPPASGLAAVQQFFEALGLTPAPKVNINVRSIQLSGAPGVPLNRSIEVKTEEKKPIYAHGVSNQPWLQVGRAQISGRLVTVPVSVPAVPNYPGQSLVGSVTVQSNGNQRFVVPVTLQVEGNVFNFDEPAPVLAPEPEPEIIEIVETVDAAPAVSMKSAPSPAATAPARPLSSPQIQTVAPPAPPAPRGYSRYRKPAMPFWVHLIPAGALALALLLVVIGDLVGRGTSPSSGGPDAHSGGPDNPASGGTDLSQQMLSANYRDWKFANLADPDPLLLPMFNPDKDKDNHRFGIVMTHEPDPRPDHAGKNKQLTFEEFGGTNNTIVNIEGSEFYFGEEQGENRVVSCKDLPKGRYGNVTVMDFPDPKWKVRVEQRVEIVPGQSRLLDTCLVWYRVENYGDEPVKVGVRFMLDTFIGTNDGVPFTAPGVKGLIRDMREFKGIEVPPYLEVVENGDDAANPGTVVRLGLRNIRLPGVDHLEEPDDVRVTHFPPQQGRQRWDVPMASIQDDKGGDSCVALYWPCDAESDAAETPAKGVRDLAFTYGLSQLDISTGGGTAVALSTPDSVPPNSDFIVTAYVYNGKAGDVVELQLPDGLTFTKGDSTRKSLEEGGKRGVVFWNVHAAAAGEYKIEAASGAAQTRPHTVVVKSKSIFG